MSEKRPFKDALTNGTGTVISRLMVIIGFPALLLMSGFVGSRFVSQFDSMLIKMDAMANKMDAQRDETNKSLNGLDVRLTGAERDIKYLSERK